jgi:beta-lactamase regulating signal transducer with metallopeptidase domain
MEIASRFVLAFVVNAAWQVHLMALAAGLGGRLLRSASARHRLLLATLACSLVVPLATSLGRGRPSAREAPFAPADASRGAVPWVGAGRSAVTSLAPSPWLANAVVTLYLAGLAVGGIRRARSWRGTVAVRRSALADPPPETVRRAAERCRSRLGLGDVLVRLSTAVASPVTLGVRRPVILVPADLVPTLAPDELVAALGHEMAHVRRRDFAWNAAAQLAAAPIAFHPATAWMLRGIRQARELACDALVSERVLEAGTYARALATLARSLAPAPAYTLGVADAGILEERVMSLVTGRARRNAREGRADYVEVGAGGETGDKGHADLVVKMTRARLPRALFPLTDRPRS